LKSKGIRAERRRRRPTSHADCVTLLRSPHFLLAESPPIG
jgi:hypothetical protein